MCSGPTLTLTGSALPPSAFQGPSNQIDNEGLWLYNTLWWSEHHQCVHVFGLSTTVHMVLPTTVLGYHNKMDGLSGYSHTIKINDSFLYWIPSHSTEKKHHITINKSTTNFNTSAISVIIVPLLITRTFPRASYSNSPSLVSSSASSSSHWKDIIIIIDIVWLCEVREAAKKMLFFRT